MAAESVGGKFQPLASGILPGYRQDICRAETYAIHMAITLFNSGVIYCDNQSVVDAFHTLVDLPFDVFAWRTHPNLDLWSEIASVLVAKGPSSFQVQKVKAHRSVHQAEGVLDQWTIVGNDKADSWAKSSIFEYLESVGLSSQGLRDQELVNMAIASEASKICWIRCQSKLSPCGNSVNNNPPNRSKKPTPESPYYKIHPLRESHSTSLRMTFLK